MLNLFIGVIMTGMSEAQDEQDADESADVAGESASETPRSDASLRVEELRGTLASLSKSVAGLERLVDDLVKFVR